jgi:hypothetical protein
MIATFKSPEIRSLVSIDVQEGNLYWGSDLSELLEKASVERELAQMTGSGAELEIEAVYSVERSEWNVQVFNCSDYSARSLYSQN